MVNATYTLVLLLMTGLTADAWDLDSFSLEKLIQRGIDYLNARLSNSSRATKSSELPSQPWTSAPEVKLKIENRKCGCVVLTRYNVPMHNQPLYTYKGTLVYPQLRNGNSTVSLNPGQSLSAHCTGTRNHLTDGNESNEIECLCGTTFRLNGKMKDFKEIVCVNRAQAELSRTGQKCSADGASLFEIGFRVNGWQKLIDVCFDEKEERTVFARHTVNPQVQGGAERNSDRPIFVEGLRELFHGRRVNNLYKKSSQLETLKILLGRDDLLNSKDLFLSRGHLAPDGDFIFSNWQHSTYFFVNAAPQWQSINGGAWLEVEDKVRRLAQKVNSSLVVSTGTLGTLELSDVNMNSVPIYLDPSGKGIPVPKYFWKNVYSSPSRQSITFVVENNPFNLSEPVCRSICKEIGWSFRSSVKRGSVLCCKSDDLKEISPYVTQGSPLQYSFSNRG